MIERSFLFLSAGAVALLASAPLHAQNQAGPFDGCKNPKFIATGERTFNRSEDTGKVSGAVEIECDDLQLFADEVEWDKKTVRAAGKITLVQRSQGLTVYAERMEMDRETRFGTFYTAQGFARLSEQPATPTGFGAQEPDIQFKGEKFERIGPRTYRLTNGKFSTCEQPTPRWEITGTQGTVVLDKRVVLRNAVLKVKDVPLLYLPVMYYPLSKENRATGFLMPSYSTSSNLGTGFNNAFFLVLGRSQDATFYHTWSSKAGPTFATDYRYVSAPGSDGNARIKVINTKASVGVGGAVVQAASRSYAIDGGVNQRLPRGFHFISNVNYFTSIIDQRRYEQNIFDLTNRSRYFGGTLSGSLGRSTRLSVRFEQQDLYNRGTTGSTFAARQGRAPQVSLTMTDKPIGRSRVYVGAAGDVAYLISQPDISRPATDQSLMRLDASPRVRMPLSSLPFLSVTSSAAWRFTHWRESINPATPTRQQVDVPITRSILDLRAEVLGPVFSRVFQLKDNGYAERLKHLIEPRFSVQWVSPFSRQNEIVAIDHGGVDTVPTGTRTITYSLTNRLLARRRSTSGPGVVRPVIAATLAQSHYSNAGAAQFDASYLSAAIGNFSALRLDVTVTPADVLSSSFQTAFDPKFRVPQYYSSFATITHKGTQVTAGWSKTQFIPGSTTYTADRASHFLRGTVTVRPFEGRVNGTYAVNYDVRTRDFVQQRLVASYSAQCCGVTMDYQTVRRPQFGPIPLPPDRRFGVSFSLAGIGSFSNPFGSFGDNNGRR